LNAHGTLAGSWTPGPSEGGAKPISVKPVTANQQTSKSRQHKPEPSRSIAIIQKVSTIKDAEIAVSKAGRLPGKTSIDDYSKWTLSVLNMPTGVGYVRRTRKMLSQEDEMEIFPVNFVDISGIAPPSDAELARIVGKK